MSNIKNLKPYNNGGVSFMEDAQGYLFVTIGAFCLLIAILFGGNVEFVLGTTQASYYLTLLIAFILILVAGIFWVSAARSVKSR